MTTQLNTPIIRKRKSTCTSASSLTEEDTLYEKEEEKINENVWDVTPARRHIKHVNDNSLRPDGNLSMRLDCMLNCLPRPANIRARCAFISE